MDRVGKLLKWKRNDSVWRSQKWGKVEKFIKDLYPEKSNKEWREVDTVFKDCLQSTFTPFDLCDQILDRLAQEISLKDCERIAVLCNLEFVHSLIKRGINPRRIWFFADVPLDEIDEPYDASLKGKRAKEWYGVNVGSVTYDRTKKKGEKVIIMPENQFDCVIMNPPYSTPKSGNGSSVRSGQKSGKSSSLWDGFVDYGIKLCRDKGHFAFITPSRWRKVNDRSWEVITRHQLLYLYIANLVEGQKMFASQTRFDYYVGHKTKPYATTIVRDENNEEYNVDIPQWDFLPNCDFEIIEQCLGDPAYGDRVLYSTSYHNQKPHVSRTKSGKYKYPCVNSTSSKSATFYSSVNNLGLFGVPKIIVGETGWDDPVIDKDGVYAMTESAFAIRFDSPQEMRTILDDLEYYKTIQGAFLWLGYRVEYRLFRLLKFGFSKEFA